MAKDFRKAVQRQLEKMGLDSHQARSGMRDRGIINNKDISTPPRPQSEQDIVIELSRTLRGENRSNVLSLIESLAPLVESSELHADLPALRVAIVEDVPAIIGHYKENPQNAIEFARKGDKTGYQSSMRMVRDKTRAAQTVVETSYKEIAQLIPDDKDKTDPASKGMATLRNLNEKLTQLQTSLQKPDVAEVRGSSARR